jgi:uncharacterized membrane protein YeiB
MYDLLLEMSHTVWKNGLTLSALGTALYVLLKQRKVKKRLRKFVPWILEDDNEIKEYVQNQKIIMEQLNLLLQERGIPWNAERFGTKVYQANGKTSSTSPWVAFFYAHFAGLRMKFNTKRGMKTMKEYLKKLGRTKFQAFLITTITNIIVLMGVLLGNFNVEADIAAWAPIISLAVQLLAGAVYMWVEGKIDQARVGGTSYEKPLSDSEFIG